MNCKTGVQLSIHHVQISFVISTLQCNHSIDTSADDEGSSLVDASRVEHVPIQRFQQVIDFARFYRFQPNYGKMHFIQSIIYHSYFLVLVVNSWFFEDFKIESNLLLPQLTLLKFRFDNPIITLINWSLLVPKNSDCITLENTKYFDNISIHNQLYLCLACIIKCKSNDTHPLIYIIINFSTINTFML